MAEWQVEFHVVPKRALTAAPTLSPRSLEDAAWWTSGALPADYRDRIGAFVTASPDSSADLESWGTRDGNRIEVRRKAGLVSTVRAWVDVRRLDARFAAGLITFVRMANAALVRGDGSVTDPTAGGFGLALRGSSAWRRVQDPASRLDPSRRSAAERVDDGDDD